MRTHGFEFEQFPAAAYLSLVDEDILLKVFAKGPAIGRRWPHWNLSLDCNVTTPDFDRRNEVARSRGPQGPSRGRSRDGA